MLKKVLFGLVAALVFVANAQAELYFKWYPNRNPLESQPRYATPEAACAYFVNVAYGIPGSVSITPADSVSYFCYDSGSTYRGRINRESVNLTCAPPLFAQFTGSGSSATWTCQEPACPVGQGKIINRTEGWGLSKDPDADDLVVDYGLPSMYDYNDGVCVGNIARVEKCYRSQVPSAQGLYRLSCDYMLIISGDSMSSGDPSADPMEPVASCPGVVGEVNGVKVCVGTSSSPLPTPAPAPDKPTDAGNPSAGPKPVSGEGSGSGGEGRTPAAGSGGNTGGPSGAAVGPGGTGARGEKGADGTAVCGAAPLPSCAVKVDETGTPDEASASGRFGQATSDLEGVRDEAKGFLEGTGIANISLPSWTWTFAFPTGCTPLVLSAYDGMEIDVCQWQPIIHDLMSVLWVIAGVWGLINLFSRATGV